MSSPLAKARTDPDSFAGCVATFAYVAA
jgi:hypothetical protein